jgi:anti-sigma B factor antagonist
MDDELTISVSPEPGYVVVSVAGEIDMATAAQFREQLASVISGGARRVVVDLARVTFMASAGIGVLTGTHRVLAGEGGSLVLAAPSPAVWRVLSVVGLDRVIPVTGSVADAAARWASEGVELPGVPGCPGVTVSSRRRPADRSFGHVVCGRAQQLAPWRPGPCPDRYILRKCIHACTVTILWRCCAVAVPPSAVWHARRAVPPLREG